MTTTFARRARALMGSVALIAGLAVVPQAWGGISQASSDAWSQDRGGGNSCLGCHGAYHLPNANLRTELRNAAGFGAYIRGRNQNVYMNGLSDSDGSLIQGYLVQMLFGEFSAGGGGTLSYVGSPPSYAYSLGAVDVGSSGVASLTIRNNRSDVAVSLAVSGVSTNSSNEFWYDAGTCGVSIPASSSCAINLHFSPTAAGSRSGGTMTLTVDSFDSSITLSGTGQVPVFNIGSNSLSFSATVNVTPGQQSTLISNSGSAPLVLSNLTIDGTDATDFSIDATGCASQIPSSPIAAGGGHCTLSLTFTPAAGPTSRTATLHISHNASGSPQSVSLSGTANPQPLPAIAVGSSALPIGNVQLGSNTTVTLTVQNTGQAPMTFSSFQIAGTNAADYTRGGTCTTSTPLSNVAPNNQCTITITFVPGGLNARPATLTINSDASNGNPVLSLGGNGVPVPAPQVSLSAAALNFGNQTIGGLYPPRTITLTNSGTATLTLSGAPSLSGSSRFALTGATTCSTSLAASASCVISIAYTPTTAGAHDTGTLTISSNAAGSPHQVTLSGDGTAAAAPLLTWSAPVSNALDFGAQATGSSTGLTATLSNSGPGGATIALANAVGADASQFGVTATACTAGVLYEGQTCTVQIQFVPGSAGPKTATVQIASNGTQPPALVLTGTGLSGPSPHLAVSDASLNFGTVRLGAQSDPLVLRLTSDGSSAVRVTAMSSTGPYTMQAKDCPALPFDLVVGASCTVSITFKPQATGVQTGQVSIASSASATNTQVTLTGQGEAAADTSSGGCSLVRGPSLTDPTLWLLAVGAAGVLVARQRQRRSGRGR